MNRLATIGIMCDCMGFSMNLFVILTLEQEIGVLRQNHNRVMMWCMDMGVLWRPESCSNLFLIMVIAGSTGSDVNRA